MCQAYEGEARIVVFMEECDVLEGFRDAKNGKLRSDNPHKDGTGQWERWDRGWNGFSNRRFPFELEARMSSHREDRMTIRRCKDAFENQGRLLQPAANLVY